MIDSTSQPSLLAESSACQVEVAPDGRVQLWVGDTILLLDRRRFAAITGTCLSAVRRLFPPKARPALRLIVCEE